MPLAQWWEDAAGDFLPWRTETLEVGRAGDGVYQGAGGPCVRLNMYVYGEENGRRVVAQIFEQEIPLYVRDDIEERHVRALLEGTDLAFRELVAAHDGKTPPMPADFFCPPLLLERLETAAQVRARLLEPRGPLDAWRRLGAPLDADDAAFEAFCAAGGLPGHAELEARRDDALARARSGGLAARMKEVYGLPLPENVIVGRAFFASLTPFEREAYDVLRILTPVNVLEWPLDGTALATTGDLPASLVWRYACDPAELVTLFTGDSDGEHIGLFYDDDEHPACGLAGSFARDATDTSWEAPTVLQAIIARLDRIAEDGGAAERLGGVERAGCLVRLVREALHRFLLANGEAYTKDQEAALVPYRLRVKQPRLPSGIAPVDAQGGTERVLHVEPANRTSFTDEERARWLHDAYAAIGAGDFVASLTIVRCLHCDANRGLEPRVLPLLVAAYKAMKRPRLAAIAETHAAHRWLSNVVTHVK